MKKLNNKGYITVEILIASIITVAIAVFLIELTVKLVSKTDDVYVDTILTTDKALIIDNIKGNIEQDIIDCGIIQTVECVEEIDEEDSKEWEICFNSETATCDCSTLIVNSEKIVYTSNQRNTTYEKKINSSLSNISSIVINSDNYFFFEITAQNTFAENDYVINIPILNRAIEGTIVDNPT